MDGELGQENIAIAFNKGKNKDLREKADKSVEELIKDGTVSKLSKNTSQVLMPLIKNNPHQTTTQCRCFFLSSHYNCEISQKELHLKRGDASI